MERHVLERNRTCDDDRRLAAAGSHLRGGRRFWIYPGFRPHLRLRSWRPSAPIVARLPAFAIATVFNFLLNRRLTFSPSRTPFGEAFVRYVMVCAVGLAINWTAYAIALEGAARLGWPASPETLPLFVALGTGVAMFATFFGFKLFAFKA